MKLRNCALTLAMAAGIAASVILGSFSAFSRECEEIQGEVLRLHIPANSDSSEDQRIKLALRDFVLEKYGTALSGCGSLDEAEKTVGGLLPEIEADCREFLAERGVGYSARAELVEMYFTTREYDRVILPAGNYTALRITLGSGEGHNWWCVIFPSLCLPAVSEPLSAEEAESIPADFEQPVKIKVRFALYEWLSGLFGNGR